MALDTPWLAAAAVLLLAAGIRFTVAIWIRRSREGWDVVDDAERTLLVVDEESKVQLLQELEAAAESEMASQEGSRTLSACSSETLRVLDEGKRAVTHQNSAPMVSREEDILASFDFDAFMATQDKKGDTQAREDLTLPTGMWYPRPFPLPTVNGEEAPVYVNAKQFHRILKRRQARQQLEESFRMRLAQQKNGMSLRERPKVDYGTLGGERKATT